MKNKIMQLVDQICNTESTNCRNLNKADLARELMNLANIPQNADIQEIPLDWNRQVVVLFLIPEDKENYYSLFAGIGNDGKFYFELSITGKNPCSDSFYFLDEEEILPIDYFVNKMNASMIIQERMFYGRYKKHYSDCETLAGSYDKTSKTIIVLIPDGRMKKSSVRGQSYKYITFNGVKNKTGRKVQITIKATCFKNAVKQLPSDCVWDLSPWEQ